MSVSSDPADVVPPGLGPLDVEAFPAYVIGFPMHVAVTLRADRPGATLKRLPVLTHESLADAVGVLCHDAGGHVVGRLDPNPVVDEDLGLFGFTLSAGKERRLLVDLSDTLPWAAIGPGTCVLTVSFAAPYTATSGPPFSVELRDPTPDERRTLDELAPERARAGSWGAWSRLPFRDPAALRGPFDRADPLRYARILRWLLRGDDALASIHPAVLGVLDGPYAPEADVIEAEIAWAAGDRAAFDAASSRVQRRAPGLAYQLDEIVAGRSELARADAERRAREVAP